jgi:hypothetical protein
MVKEGATLRIFRDEAQLRYAKTRSTPILYMGFVKIGQLTGHFFGM